MVWVRPREEVVRKFKIQQRALVSSCTNYDSGEEWEAERLSTAVVNLVYDFGKDYTSILTQLGVRDSLTYICSGIPCIPGNLVTEVVLAKMLIAPNGRYLPWLGSSPVPSALVDFKEWWESDVILKERDEFKMTRKQLVISLRSKDGGSHLDPILRDPNYTRFTRETMIHVGSSGSPQSPLLGAERASMRQIAWELLVTLNSWRPS